MGVETLNNVANPVDLKMRNSVSWSRDNISASVFVDYVDSYEDTRQGTVGFGDEIGSWTTVDFTVQYSTEDRLGSLLDDLALSVNIRNLFDRDPPFVVQSVGINMDPTNANAIGRFISFDITKSW